MKKKKKIIIFGLFLIFLFSVSSLNLLNFANAKETADEDDVPFEIFASQTVSTEDMVGGDSMGLGEYKVQSGGKYNRWYQEPSISNGDFNFQDMKADLTDINHPFYSETNQSTEFSKEGFQGKNTVNSSKIEETTIAKDKVSDVAVDADYNYSYGANNVTSLHNNYGSESGTGNLNKTDTDNYTLQSEYDYSKKYNVTNVNIADGDHDAGDLEDLKDDDSSTGYKIDSQKLISDKSTSGTSLEYKHIDENRYAYESSSSDDNYGVGVTVAGTPLIEIDAYARFRISDVLNSYSDISKYYNMKISVRYAWATDLNEVTENEEGEADVFVRELDPDTSYNYQSFGSVEGTGSSNYEYRTKTFTTSQLERYISSDKDVDIRFNLDHTADWKLFAGKDALTNLKIDSAKVELYGAHAIDADFKTTQMNYARVKWYSTATMSNTKIRTYTGSEWVNHFEGLSTGIDFSFDCEPSLHPQGLNDYVNVYGWDDESFSVTVYNAEIYDKHEYQRAETIMGFDFTNQTTMDDPNTETNYNCTLNYRASHTDAYDIYYGRDDDWNKLGDLDATSKTTETFRFSSSYNPQIRIYTLEESYSDTSDLTIWVDQLNITAIYQPFLNVYAKNVNYSLATDPSDYKYDNLTLSFVDNYNYTQTNGTVRYKFSSSQFSEYDEDDEKEFILNEQNLTLTFEVAFRMDISVSFFAATSSMESVAPPDEEMQLNGADVLPKSPNSGYAELYEYPENLDFTADKDLVFKSKIDTNFLFESDLYISSRRVLRQSFALTSDHPITIEKISFDPDLLIESVWLSGDDYDVQHNNVTVDKVMDPDEEMVLDVYLDDDIYKELEYLYDNLGQGEFGANLYGTSPDLTYTDLTKNSDLGMQLPEGFYLNYMDAYFSNLRYQQDYTANSSNDINDYGYSSPTSDSESVDYSQDYYQTETEGRKVDEGNPGGFEDVYSEDFSSEPNGTDHEYYPDGYNSSYGYDNKMYMENEFPSEAKNDTWDQGDVDGTLDSGSDSNSNVTDISSNTDVDSKDQISRDFLSLDGDYASLNSTSAGHYPATYSFGEGGNMDAEDEVGDTGKDISFVDSIDSHENITAEIIKKIDGHSRILHQEAEDVELYHSRLRNYFDSQSIGTVEFWTKMDLEDYFSWSLGSNDLRIYFYNDHVVNKGGSESHSHDFTEWTHIKVDFECFSDADNTFDLYIDGSKVFDDAEWNDEINSVEKWYSYMKHDPSEVWFDSIGYSWDPDYEVGDNLHMIPPELNTTFTTQVGTQYDTIEYLNLLYSHKTDIPQEINMSVWNWNTNNWLLVNSSVNNQSFYSQSKDDLPLSDILNSSNYLRVNFYGLNNSNEFQLYIDQLKYEYNYTTTEGDIYSSLSKSIDYSFLNRYDSDTDYQKLYNITTQFHYRFTNTSKYSNFTEFIIDSHEHTLMDSGEWEFFSFNFEFNSTNVDAFETLFNVSNGILEIKNMNHTLKFNCLDTSNRVALGQYYSFDLPISLDYQQRHRGNWSLNFTIDFDNTYTEEWYNQLNSSQFLMRLSATHEDGTDTIYNINMNESLDQEFSINISKRLEDIGKYEFKGADLEIYLAGNNSVTLDDLTLYDYDDEFYEARMWISDTTITEEDSFTLYRWYTDRNIDHVDFHLKWGDVNTQGLTAQDPKNDTVQTHSFPADWENAGGADFGEMWFTFYDTQGNYEKYYVNWTIITEVEISTGYKNPVFINENNTVSSHIESKTKITRVDYDNSTDYLNEYTNSSGDNYKIYEFNFTLSYPTAKVYDISIRVTTEYNDTFYVNITNLEVIERSTTMEIDNVKSSYEQDDGVRIDVILMDCYNCPLIDKNVSYTIESPNSSIIVNTTDTTDNQGEIDIDLDLNVSYSPGFYHLNTSFAGTDDYMGVWKLMSFEVTPIEHIVNSTDDVNLTVNSDEVNNNTYRFDTIEANSFNIDIEHPGDLKFDLKFENISIYYSHTFDYSEFIDFEFEFDRSGSQIDQVQVDDFNMTQIPENFTYYYFNNREKDTYSYDRYLDALYPEDPINSTYDNLDTFEIELRYLRHKQKRTQLTDAPDTTDDYVEYQQTFRTDLDYRFWYFETDADIVDIPSFTYEPESDDLDYPDDFITADTDKYKFDLDGKSEINDLFDGTFHINPHYDISYSVKENNGTYAEVEIDYKADLNVDNVTAHLDLSDDNLYMDNWTLNVTQNEDFELEIPALDFKTSEQTLTIEGNSSVPTASVIDYESDQDWTRIAEDTEPIDYAAFLEFEKFSQHFYVQKEDDWTMYDLYYGDNSYGIETVSDSLGSIERGEGFDPSVTDAYAHFKVDPFEKVDWNWNKDTDNITITINSSLAVEKAFFQVQFNPDQAHELELVSNDTNVFDLSDSGDYEGYLYFYTDVLPEGETVIKIHINYVEPHEMLIQGLPLIGVSAALIGVYYYIKQDEERVEEIGEYVSDKLKPFIDKLRKDEASWDEIQEFRIKDGKIEAKMEKK